MCFDYYDKFKGTKFRPASVCERKGIPMMNLKYEYYHKAVYPSWKTNIVTPKPIYLGNRSIDCWWVENLPKEDKLVWTNGIEKYQQMFNQFIKKNGKDFSSLPICFSQPYYLEK